LDLASVYIVGESEKKEQYLLVISEIIIKICGKNISKLEVQKQNKS
jgi:hypothetical protein